MALGAVALLFVLSIVSIVGVFWYATRSTNSASSELNKAIKDATADIARESADTSANPEDRPGSSTPTPGTHAEHREPPQSQAGRVGVTPPVVQPPKPPAAPDVEYSEAEAAKAEEELNKALKDLPKQLGPTPPNVERFDPTKMLLQMAHQQFASGNYHAAFGMYPSVLKRDPNNTAAKNGLRRAQEALKKAGPNSR